MRQTLARVRIASKRRAACPLARTMSSRPSAKLTSVAATWVEVSVAIAVTLQAGMMAVVKRPVGHMPHTVSGCPATPGHLRAEGERKGRGSARALT
jgi:hypothetical protein